MEEIIRESHSIIVEDRNKFTLSGVKDVLGFDDETISLETNLGRLVIKGFNLHILNFNTETCDLSGEGKVHALVYTADEKSRGFVSRIFR